jgi:putative acetyltransferase
MLNKNIWALLLNTKDLLLFLCQHPHPLPTKDSFKMITIQPEKEEYYTAIHELNVFAFGREDEAELVNKLRKSSDFVQELSLVAVKDKKVVGHILFSPVAIHTKKRILPALALAPMAVHPEFQNRGIGSELVRQGLERCRKLGYKVVIVVGHPTYYPRFGFISARAKGLETPFPVPDEAFMVIELTPGALNGISGMIIYPPAFEEV